MKLFAHCIWTWVHWLRSEYRTLKKYSKKGLQFTARSLFLLPSTGMTITLPEDIEKQIMTVEINGTFDQWSAWPWWRTHLLLSLDYPCKLARHAGNNRTRYIDKADWFSYKTKHQSATVFYKYLFRPTKATEATGPQAVERRGLKFAVIYLSFWRIMAEERKVLLALDGSANSEYALNCKYKIALFNISTCVSSALCR